MARIKLNSLLADLRGRFGSVVVSSNKNGFYVKTLKTPTNPRTVLQSNHRLNFARLTYGWNLVSAPNKALWLTYSQRADNERLDWFGDPYYPDSRAQYISLNLMRIAAGLAVTDTPPTTDRPADLPDMLAGIDASGGFDSYVDNDAAFDASIIYVHLAVSIATNPGRETPPTPFKFVGINPVSGTWPWVIQTELDTLYGYMAQTGTWFMAISPVSDDCRLGTTLYISAPMGEEYP